MTDTTPPTDGTTRAGASGAARGTAPDAELPTRPGARTSPIVWGALVLVFCAYIAQRAFGAEDIDAAWWVTLTVIGLGVLLLGVGLAVLVRNKRPR